MLSQDPTTTTIEPTTETSVFVCAPIIQDPGCVPFPEETTTTTTMPVAAVTVATAPAARAVPAELAYTGTDGTLAVAGALLVATGIALVRRARTLV